MANLGVIGVGLIGGSFALSWKKIYPDSKIMGWDYLPDHLTIALEKGIIDEIAENWEVCLNSCKCLVLAIPVDAIRLLLPKMLAAIPKDHYIVDFGSTKKSIADVVKDLPNRKQYVAAHPMAGTEYSGPLAARDDLYLHKKMILCDTELTEQRWIREFTSHSELMGMLVSDLSSKEHDYFISVASHLSHAVSFSLSHTVLRQAEKHENILNLSGSGLASSVRLAKSDPTLWTELFLDNRERILVVMDEFIKDFLNLRQLLEEKDFQKIFNFLEKARTIGSKLP